jgi:hypothetical protein
MGENEGHCGQLKCSRWGWTESCLWARRTFRPPSWPDEPETNRWVCICPLSVYRP